LKQWDDNDMLYLKWNTLENFRLLEKHRKKLSVYFALFILLSLWFVEGIFLLSIFTSNNIKLVKKLETKYIWVTNILENKENYFKKIEENDSTTKIILEKTLDGVTIIENEVKILWDINISFLWNQEVSNSKNYKYYKQDSVINWNSYTVIIKEENEYSYYNFLIQYWYFLLFTLPFSMLFYIIWYLFVWKNFIPIKETISSLETFSGNMNHEMKTPLAEIISTLSLAKKVKWNYAEAIDISLNSSKKLNKILDSLLWIINLVDSSYKKEKINLIEQLNDIIKENEKKSDGKNITMRKIFSEKNYSLIINKEHYDICVWNILKNAIKYSNKNWNIDIGFYKWRLEIQDYGIGIEEKNLKNIFNRYFRENYVKQEWYWLWLALVKKITDLHSWKMNIESKKDIWTKVSIQFI